MTGSIFKIDHSPSMAHSVRGNPRGSVSVTLAGITVDFDDIDPAIELIERTPCVLNSLGTTRLMLPCIIGPGMDPCIHDKSLPVSFDCPQCQTDTISFLSRPVLPWYIYLVTQRIEGLNKLHFYPPKGRAPRSPRPTVPLAMSSMRSRLFLAARRRSSSISMRGCRSRRAR